MNYFQAGSPQQWRDRIKLMASQGAASWPALTEEGLQALLTAANLSPKTLKCKESNRYGVSYRYRIYSDQHSNSERFREIAKQTDDYLFQGLDRAGWEPEYASTRFNERTVIEYDPRDLITPHNDGGSYIGLILILVLVAGGVFYLSADRSPTSGPVIPANAGWAILMPARPTALFPVCQPHGVMEVQSRRLTVVFRQRIQKPGA